MGVIVKTRAFAGLIIIIIMLLPLTPRLSERAEAYSIQVDGYRVVEDFENETVLDRIELGPYTNATLTTCLHYHGERALTIWSTAENTNTLVLNITINLDEPVSLVPFGTLVVWVYADAFSNEFNRIEVRGYDENGYYIQHTVLFNQLSRNYLYGTSWIMFPLYDNSQRSSSNFNGNITKIEIRIQKVSTSSSIKPCKIAVDFVVYYKRVILKDFTGYARIANYIIRELASKGLATKYLIVNNYASSMESVIVIPGRIEIVNSEVTINDNDIFLTSLYAGTASNAIRNYLFLNGTTTLKLAYFSVNPSSRPFMIYPASLNASVIVDKSIWYPQFFLGYNGVKLNKIIIRNSSILYIPTGYSFYTYNMTLIDVNFVIGAYNMYFGNYVYLKDVYIPYITGYIGFVGRYYYFGKPVGGLVENLKIGSSYSYYIYLLISGNSRTNGNDTLIIRNCDFSGSSHQIKGSVYDANVFFVNSGDGFNLSRVTIGYGGNIWIGYTFNFTVLDSSGGLVDGGYLLVYNASNRALIGNYSIVNGSVDGFLPVQLKNYTGYYEYNPVYFEFYDQYGFLLANFTLEVHEPLSGIISPGLGGDYTFVVKDVYTLIVYAEWGVVQPGWNNTLYMVLRNKDGRPVEPVSAWFRVVAPGGSVYYLNVSEEEPGVYYAVFNETGRIGVYNVTGYAVVESNESLITLNASTRFTSGITGVEAGGGGSASGVDLMGVEIETVQDAALRDGLIVIVLVSLTLLPFLVRRFTSWLGGRQGYMSLIIWNILLLGATLVIMAGRAQIPVDAYIVETDNGTTIDLVYQDNPFVPVYIAPLGLQIFMLFYAGSQLLNRTIDRLARRW